MCLELRGFPGVAGALRDTGGVLHPGCGRMEFAAPLMVRLQFWHP